jgi:hypothetical protein
MPASGLHASVSLSVSVRRVSLRASPRTDARHISTTAEQECLGTRLEHMHTHVCLRTDINNEAGGTSTLVFERPSL